MHGAVLAVIPARGGSKGVPRKNVRVVAGLPLVAWTIRAAQDSEALDNITVSSDDPETLAIAASFGVEALRRPPRLAQDKTPGTEAVLHAALAQRDPPKIVVCLQPTSPLRTHQDIDNALQLFTSSAADNCVSVTRVRKPPEWMYRLGPDLDLDRYSDDAMPLTRQEAPPLVALNGAIYITRLNHLAQTRSFTSGYTIGYNMDSRTSLDIDDELDMEIAECLLSRRNSA